MTEAPQKPKRLGRPQQWAERAIIQFAAGTFARVALVLRDGEDRSSFVRTAVDRELERREAQAKEERP